MEKEKLYKYVVVDDVNCRLHYCRTQKELDAITRKLTPGLYTVKPSSI